MHDWSQSFILAWTERILNLLHGISPSQHLKRWLGGHRPQGKMYGLVDTYVVAWFAAVTVLFVACCVFPKLRLVPALVWCVAILTTIRLVEIYGVALDVLVFDRVRAQRTGTQHVVSSYDRSLLLGMENFLEVMMHFSLLYFFVHGTAFSEFPLMASDALYYSAVTITTLGYGDLKPLTTAARLTSGAEAICGVLALALILSRFVSLVPHSPESRQPGNPPVGVPAAAGAVSEDVQPAPQDTESGSAPRRPAP